MYATATSTETTLPGPTGQERRWSASLVAASLVVVMAVGSLSIWTVLPLTWLWLASNIIQTNMFSYLFALIACPVSMVQAARGLDALYFTYSRVRGQEAGPAAHTGWLKSISDERRSLRSLNLLEWLTIGSVFAAFVGWVVYYFVLSHPAIGDGRILW
jgi:hypothetical protein